jgi:molybdopterin biosynthesis enzyme
MADLPGYEQALARLMELSYPATTLKVPPERAIGHRLAKPVIAKGNQPLRPFALVDGLAVAERDVLLRPAQPEHAASESGAPGAAEDAGAPSSPADEVVAADGAVAGDGAVDQHTAAEGAQNDTYVQEEPWVASPLAADAPETAGPEKATLELRPAPASARREDALAAGQAVIVRTGEEVPRGAGFVYPLSWIAAEGQSPPPEELDSAGQPPAATSEESGEEEGLPVAEPPRIWDLAAGYARGIVEVPMLPSADEKHMVAIGDWSRNREAVFAEHTVIRAGEAALLQALEVDEVEVYRRPVVGVASLAPPFPVPQPPIDEPAARRECPLAALAVELFRSARIAALPLGFAPQRFRQLLGAVEQWLGQVDILVLVGGSHHHAAGLGHDVLRSAGRVQLSGVDLTPAGALAAGTIGEHPVIAMPGSLPDVLVGCVLFGRPLVLKHLTPANYSPTVDIVLEQGSHLTAERPSALPVRFGFDPARNAFATRFSGRIHDPWMDYVRGQALILVEAGQRFVDGEVVSAYTY